MCEMMMMMMIRELNIVPQRLVVRQQRIPLESNAYNGARSKPKLTSLDTTSLPI